MRCSSLGRSCRLALPAGLLAVALAAAAGAAEYKRNETYAYTATPLTSLEVRNPSGLVEIIGEEREDLHLDVLYRIRGRGDEQAADLMKRLGIAVIPDAERSGRVEIEPVLDGEPLFSRNAKPPRGYEVRVDLQLHVPRGVHVEAAVTSGRLEARDLAGGAVLGATSGDLKGRRLAGELVFNLTSGDVDLEELRGPLEIAVTSGDLRLASHEGDATITCFSGDVDLSAVSGDLAVSSISGSILVAGVGGRLRANTTSGDIRVRDVDGSVWLRTSSGFLELLDAGRPGQSLDLASSSGDIHVTLRDTASLRVSVTTAIGAIRCRLPLEIETIARKKLVGVLGGGKQEARIETASGDIRILGTED